jgi:hypothetical protein
MKINRDEIATLCTRLREEIMERECLLAAVQLFEKYAASGHAPSTIDLGGLLSTPVSGRPTIELEKLPASPPPPAPAALPPPPPVERYLHPELKAMSYRSNAALVRWAIGRMTADYSSHDIAAMLEREGEALPISSISTVLYRMKIGREIEEIQRGEGPHPAIMRCPSPRIDESPGSATEPEEGDDSSIGLVSHLVG